MLPNAEEIFTRTNDDPALREHLLDHTKATNYISRATRLFFVSFCVSADNEPSSEVADHRSNLIRD